MEKTYIQRESKHKKDTYIKWSLTKKEDKWVIKTNKKGYIKKR